MSILWMIVVGAVVGALAKLIMPGRDPGGIIVTILLGIAGSWVASWAGRAMGLYREGSAPGFIAAILGAIAILAVYRLLVGRRSALRRA